MLQGAISMIFTDDNFYVYAYIGDDNLPYYIGKGRGNRYKDKTHRVAVPTDKSKIVFVYTNITELWAFALERRLIKWYGRKDRNTGILENRSDGGDGPAGQNHTGTNNPMWGKKHSIESKRLQSEANKGIAPPNKGKTLGPYSLERRTKMSAGQVGRVLSPETKEKIRQARLKYWANR
jgi:hypothetical protein